MSQRFDAGHWVDADRKVDLGNITGTVAIPDKAELVTATLTGNVTFTLPTAKRGKTVELVLTQDGTGSRTVAVTGAKAAGGALGAATTTAGAKDILRLKSYDGSTFLANYVAKAVA